MDRFFIVRHGNTFDAGEPVRRIGARTDIALTDEGRRQGEALGWWFENCGIRLDHTYCGPLIRSRDTAALILGSQPDPRPPTSATWLDEIDHGLDEGREEEEVIARIGRAALTRWDREAVAPCGWVVDRERRIEGWRALFANRGRGNILLVTSNGAARFALIATGRKMPRSLKLRTGAMGILERETSGRLRVHDWDFVPARPKP